MGACFVGNADIVSKLLKAGASLDPVDRVKKNAATYAAANGCLKCVELLLNAGVSVNAPLDNNLTLLMWAAAYGKDDIVRYLLSHGAEKSLKDNRGLTALEMAQEAKQNVAVSLLE
jgi:ankyrin repeat protein